MLRYLGRRPLKFASSRPSWPSFREAAEICESAQRGVPFPGIPHKEFLRCFPGQENRRDSRCRAHPQDRVTPDRP